MTQDTVRQLDESIQANRQHIELDKALERLEANRDFKLLITDGYLRDEAVRLVHLKSDPSFQTPERQASVVTQIDAIGGLLAYFRLVSQTASMAARSIADAEAMRVELLEEEANRG